MLFNYGALPQTWENPNHTCAYTGKYGDDDPLDVIDIGDVQAVCGQVYKVHILGVLGLIDQDEMDWKIIAINVCDPICSYLHDIYDVETYKPGVLDAIRNWLRNYKIAEGKKKNSFAFNEEYQNTTFAKNIITHMHREWKKRSLASVKEAFSPQTSKL
jgi:inorganic pyrophosphatase